MTTSTNFNCFSLPRKQIIYFQSNMNVYKRQYRIYYGYLSKNDHRSKFYQIMNLDHIICRTYCILQMTCDSNQEKQSDYCTDDDI